MKKKELKKTQRVLIILDNSVSFYTTVMQIRDGVGVFGKINESVRNALMVLEMMRKKEDLAPIGLTGSWCGHNVQLSLML